jgi:hypothetical protein
MYRWVYCGLALVPRYMMANIVVTVAHITIATMAICGRGTGQRDDEEVVESKKWKCQRITHCCDKVILQPCKMNYVKPQILYSIFLHAKQRILQAPKFHWKF